VTDWQIPDHSRSRAVLVGTSQYAEWPPLPAAANSLDRMYRLLTGPLCGWPAEQVKVWHDEPVPGDLPDRLVELFRQAEDVALFYYVGHGYLDHVDDVPELCLGLVNSRLEGERRATTSLTFSNIRRALRASNAAKKIVLLDCCGAGQVILGKSDFIVPEHPRDEYILAAAGLYGKAFCEDERQAPVPCTYFTKFFAELIEHGIPTTRPG